MNWPSKDSRNKEISTMYDVFDWDIFTWKIPNLSSIPYAANYVVQSPIVLFKNASWIFKMYPYGQTQYQTEGNIDVIIERLHSQTPRHEVVCEMYCKNASNEKFNHKSLHFGFDSKWPFSRVHHFMQSLKEWELNNALTLVFEFGMLGKPKSEQDSQTKSIQSSIDFAKIYISDFCKRIHYTGEICKISSNKGNSEIGRIFKEYSEFKSFCWKVYDLPSDPPAGYQAPSSPFSFASASWILKAWPYYTEHSSERKICVALERLHSEVPEHNVMLKICLSYPHTKVVDGSFSFNSSHSQEEMLQFPCDIFLFHLKIEMKMKNADIESDIKSSKETLKYEPVPFASLPPESSKEALKCEPVPFASLSSSFGFPPRQSLCSPSNKFFHDMKELLIKHEDYDVILKVKGLEFPAHKVILKARSPVFASTLRNDMNKKEICILDIEDCDPSSFSDFLHFLYSGCVENLSKRNVFSLFSAADKYDVQDLKSECMDFMKKSLSVDTCHETNCIALA